MLLQPRGCSIGNSLESCFSLVLGVMPKADSHATRLSRMRRLCSTFDDLHEHTRRLCRGLTAEASRANRAALKYKVDRRRWPR